jgi:hypothetical protein
MDVNSRGTAIANSAAISTRPQLAFHLIGAPSVESIDLCRTSSSSAHPVIAAPLQIARPRVLSFPIRSAALRVQTYQFRPPIELKSIPVANGSARVKPATVNDAAGMPTSPTVTRLKPPGDIVKLEDRLWYVLQPSLETLMARGSLDFPHHPFPYQLEGVAFLYPRVSAVLADEMGLGKTMQAITAVRMLLHAGEIQSVLLVCPKPLVTNWQREFAQWAPELPVMAIEGDPNRRAWQWRLADAPVKIANYEALCRDATLVLDEQLKFDLVLLDESQRIKNRSSTTSEVVCSLSRRRSGRSPARPSRIRRKTCSASLSSFRPATSTNT